MSAEKLKLLPVERQAKPAATTPQTTKRDGRRDLKGTVTALVTSTVTRFVTDHATAAIKNSIDAAKVTGLPLDLSEDAEVAFWGEVGRWLKTHSFHELIELFAELQQQGYSVPNFRSVLASAS